MNESQSRILVGAGNQKGRAEQRRGNVIGIVSPQYDAGAVCPRPRQAGAIYGFTYLPVSSRRRPIAPTMFKTLSRSDYLVSTIQPGQKQRVPCPEFHVVHKPSRGRGRTVGEEIEFNLDGLPRVPCQIQRRWTPVAGAIVLG